MIKRILKLVVIGTAIVIFSLYLLYSCSVKVSFDKLKYEREAVVEQVITGNLSISDTGIINLPNEKTYLSDGGKCVLVEYKYKKYGVYFFSVVGMMGDSKGYLYELNLEDTTFFDKASTRFNFIDIELLDDNWYKCKTSD